MDEHTNEPWRVGKGRCIVSDEPVPEIRGSGAIDRYGGHMIAESVVPRNARRIVACVNACVGHETKQLEEWAAAGGMAHLFGIVMCMNQAAAMVRAEKQRDKLLAACVRIVGAFDKLPPDHPARYAPLFINDARDAIASVKGGAE